MHAPTTSDLEASAQRTLRWPGDGRAVLSGVALIALAHRIVLLAVGLVATGGGQAGLGERALSMWSRWDAPHLLRVAEVGYRDSGEDALFIVFLPGYPALVAAVATVVRSQLVAGLLVSFAASTLAGWLLHRLIALDGSPTEAWRAVIVLFAFPTAYFLAAPFSESVFLAAVLGATYAARTARWRRAGAAAALATATRLQALPLLAALGLTALRDRADGTVTARRLGWVAFGGAGILAYLAINLAVHGDPFHFLEVQRSHWSNRAVPPWRPLRDAVGAIAAGGLSQDLVTIYWGRLMGAAFAVATLAVGVRRLRLEDQVFGWASLAMILSPSWLISLPRYLLGVYPLFMVLARVLRRRAVFIAVVAASAAFQVLLFARYAAGRWTF